MFTSEIHDGTAVVHLHGVFEPGDDPSLLADHFRELIGDAPLLLDLSDVRPIDGTEVRGLVCRLETASEHHSTVLVHRDLTARRLLRSLSRRLPVVPDARHLVDGRFPVALDPRLIALQTG